MFHNHIAQLAILLFYIFIKALALIGLLLQIFVFIIIIIIPLWRPRRRWEGNIGMDLEEIGINAGKWVDLAQDRDYWRALVNAALNLRVHKPCS